MASVESPGATARGTADVSLQLGRFAGEVDLHRVVAARLLPVLTQQATICGCLAHLDAWRALVRAFAEQAEPIRALAGPTVRALAKALTVAAGGLPDQAAAWQYTTHLMHTLTGQHAARSAWFLCRAFQSFRSFLLACWSSGF